MSRMDEALALIERAHAEESMPVPSRSCDPGNTLREMERRRQRTHGLRLEASVLAIAALIERLEES